MMQKFILFLVVILCFVAADELVLKYAKLRSFVRIVGGNETTIEENPWQVSIQAFGIHNCGGSIISSDTIITAAHCVDGLISQFYEVVSGTTDLLQEGTRIHLKEAIVHENYDGLSNDIAIIKLVQNLTFSEKIQAISLTSKEPFDGSIVKVTGWGRLHASDLITPNILHGVDINIINREQCANDYANVEDATIDGSMICAGIAKGGKDSCSGDSGGPLTQDGVLVGIVSWGVGCGQASYPGVYTNVAAVRQWIKDNSGI